MSPWNGKGDTREMKSDNIRIVLVDTTHPGNIGGVARAMKNMGLAQLYLVNPRRFPDAEATARASGADDVLRGSVVCTDLATALQGCRVVYGTSARVRSIRWPQFNPRQAARAIGPESGAGPVAIVFGRENSGLTNEEMDACNCLIHIPTNREYSSLNLAAAVQVLAYELRMLQEDVPVQDAPLESEWATHEDMEGFYQHMQEMLLALEFMDADNPRHTMRRIKRLFNRSRLEKMELNMLRGVFKAVLKKIN